VVFEGSASEASAASAEMRSSREALARTTKRYGLGAPRAQVVAKTLQRPLSPDRFAAPHSMESVLRRSGIDVSRLVLRRVTTACSSRLWITWRSVKLDKTACQGYLT
jgi:hypothetical protein